MESSSPVNKDLYFASSLHTAKAAGPQPPPSASQMRGIKVMPSSRQDVSVSRYVRLKFSFYVVAAVPSSADLMTLSLLRPLVMARSKAAGMPLRHLGRYTSAGLLCEFGSLPAPFS